MRQECVAAQTVSCRRGWGSIDVYLSERNAFLIFPEPNCIIFFVVDKIHFVFISFQFEVLFVGGMIRGLLSNRI